jgi:hypothetical protein
MFGPHGKPGHVIMDGSWSGQLSALVRRGQQVPGYLFGTFILAYGTEILKVSRDFLLVAVLAASVASLVSRP